MSPQILKYVPTSQVQSHSDVIIISDVKVADFQLNIGQNLVCSKYQNFTGFLRIKKKYGDSNKPCKFQLHNMQIFFKMTTLNFSPFIRLTSTLHYLKGFLDKSDLRLVELIKRPKRPAGIIPRTRKAYPLTQKR